MNDGLQKAFEKCMGITGSFEGASWGGSAGNFDGAGISAFLVQWNFSQKTLQPLIVAMHDADPDLFDLCAGSRGHLLLTVCKSNSRAVEQSFVNDATEGTEFEKAGNYFQGGSLLKREWKTVFTALGKNFENAQKEHIEPYLDRAIVSCKEFGLRTERGVAFCFDEQVQQGNKLHKDHDLFVQKLKEIDLQDEPARLDWLLNHAEMDTTERWRPDVAERRYCIVKGSGIVHGAMRDLAKEFGLGDVIVDFT